MAAVDFLLLQTAVQKVGKEVVITIPLPLGIEGDEEEVGGFDVTENGVAIAVGEGIAEVGVELSENGRF